MSRKRAEREPAFIVLADKPEGPTSHDVVLRARRTLGTRRVGHTGTLDPLASGLLILCVGRATRLVPYFHLPPKTYEAELVLGTETSTDDRGGEAVRREEGWRRVTEADLREALALHTGRLRQRPPAYSAVRVGGRRAHRLAREGEPPLLAERTVEVRSIELLRFDPPAAFIRATVSTGTYVRGLARDVGRHLGCGAHLSALRRIAIGPLRVEDAVPAESMEPGRPIPGSARLEPDAALPWLPARALDAGEAARVSAGGSVPRGELLAPDPAGGPLPGAPLDLPVRLRRDGRLLAVAEPEGDVLRPRKVLG